MASNDDQLIRRYLLGELKGDEKDQFEDRYFQNNALLQEILRVEQQLIDAYSSGSLTGEDYARFERGLRSSARWRAEVRLSKDLMEYRSRQPRRLSTGRFAASVAAVLALGICGYLALRPRTEGGKASLPRSSQAPAGIDVSYVLQGQRLRNSEAPKPLLLQMNVTTVNLRAEGMRQRFVRYAAVLATYDGTTVLHLSSLRPEKDREPDQSVIIPVPASKLANGDYILTLTGLPDSGVPQEVEVYTFRVERPQ